MYNEFLRRKHLVTTFVNVLFKRNRINASIEDRSYSDENRITCIITTLC